MGESPSRSRRLLGYAVRYGVGLLAVAWLAGQVEFGRLLAVLGDLRPATVALLVLVTLAGLAGRFYTWHVLMNRVGTATYAAAASTDLVVNFVNQLLPSRLSGRAAAPFVVRSETGIAGGDAVAVAGVHTGLYAVCYGVVASVGLAAGLDWLSPGILLLLGLSTLLYLLAGVSVLLLGANLTAVDRFVGGLAGAAERVPGVGERLAGLVRSLPAFTEASASAFRTLSTDPRSVVPYVLGWLAAMVVAPALRFWVLFEALGVAFDPPLALLPLFILVAYSVTLLPLTPGGIGVSEATATAVFVSLGASATAVVPIVFIDRFLSVYLPALVGWYPSLRLDFSSLAAD